MRSYDFEDFDLVIGMDSGNISDLRELAPSPEAQEKIVPMIDLVHNLTTTHQCIPDPYYEGAEGFELVLDMLEDGINHLVDCL